MNKKISDVQVIPIKASDGLIGFASLIFEDSFYLGGIGIYTRPQGGLRLTYPTRKHPSGCINVYHPINKPIADYIEHEVTKKFYELLTH